MIIRRRRSAVGKGEIFYQEAGSGDPVVLVHGLSASARWWMHNIGALAVRHHVYVVDLIGFGGSRRQGPFVLTEAAEQLERWMAKLGLARASVVGHSMGGFIAADLAAHFPERVDRLVLVDAAALPLGRTYVRNAMGVLEALRHMPPSFLPVLVTDALRAGPVTIIKAVRELLGTDISDRLTEIQAPTLLVWGEKDKIVPLELGRQLHRMLPHAAFTVIRDAGHNPMWDRPRAFNEVVLHFLTAGAAAGRRPRGHVAKE